jgi:hypothetical protein
MQQALTTLPPKDWITKQVVVFDWYDGPRQGVAWMTKPECEFVFELLTERHNPDGLDDRLFRVSELPPGSVTQILEAIRLLGNPANEVWVPLWKFDSEQERQRSDQEIDRILSQQKRTPLVISSRDMITFQGCGEVDQEKGVGLNFTLNSQ